MVSLSRVESDVRAILQEPELPMVAINLPDSKKGEKVILLIQKEEVADLRQKLIEGSMPSLYLPAAIYAVEEVPVLGSGKLDFCQARKLAEGLELKGG